ncbi:hypothetical protein L2E82_15645 [Cichorium intybus]|uniref:Uncharacterized protein n=1 Tax=Cichorium intybus TaxID=13427 RepID=A0ACB9F3C7_CICIN|nr:hypothetical protein L1887_35023 [Cichorium endivia]KAI3765607.1 hypothetical protein L2E82_15645 [Cichorium intybus]
MRTPPPSVAPLSSCSTSRSTSCTLVGRGVGEDDEHWRNFDNSVSAVSFGLVATAILISMFLAMALFERFLRPPSSASATGARNRGDLESQMVAHGKLEFPSPKANIYAREVSVLMPGEETPTFIANPVPSLSPP